MRTQPRRRAALGGACLLLTFVMHPGNAAAVRGTGAVVSTIPNVRVSHDRYPDHAEPALAVNPRNGLNLLGAAMDVDRSPTPGTFASFDGGRTWHDNGALPLPTGFTAGGDVSVAFTPQGTGFVAAEAINGLNANVRGVYVWRTDDGGRSFRRPVAVASGQFVDHPWLVADMGNGHGAGNLYVAWVTRRGTGSTQLEGLAFSRSLDGGRSFAAPRIISAPPGGITAPVVAAGPAGAVSVAYVTARGAGAGPEAHIYRQARRAVGTATPELAVEVISSTDGGLHFGRATTPGPAAFGLTPATGLLIPTGPSLAASPHDGTIYVAYAANHPATTHADIVLARSRDGGRTWNAPVHVTNGSDGAVYFQPRVVVDNAGGVAVSFLALAHGRVDAFMERSATHGASFGPSLRITSRSFDPALGLPGGKEGLWWIGDYQGLAAGPGVLHPFWNDTRSGHLEIFTAAVPAG